MVNSYESILHVSPGFSHECKIERDSFSGKKLEALLSGKSLEHVREAMTNAAEGIRGNVILTMQDTPTCTLPMKVSYANIEDGELYLFYGNIVDRLGKLAEWEKEDVVKELACLYSVADWIKVSATVKDFFTDLPLYISRGMHYPEYTIVYAKYQDVEYGRKPPGEYISTDIEVNGKVRDRIQVPVDVDQETVRALALETEGARRHVSGRDVVKVIVVPGRLVNVVVK